MTTWLYSHTNPLFSFSCIVFMNIGEKKIFILSTPEKWLTLWKGLEYCSTLTWSDLPMGQIFSLFGWESTKRLSAEMVLVTLALKETRSSYQLHLEEHKLFLGYWWILSTDDFALNHISDPEWKAPQTHQFTNSFSTSERVQGKRSNGKIYKGLTRGVLNFILSYTCKVHYSRFDKWDL